jgi:hypothetical protein
MAIQFQCPGCRQPIEVDDVWAEKLVACPYCRQTVTAPAQSTLALPEAVVGARPTSGEGAWNVPPFDAAPALDSGRNSVALVGLLLTIAAWITFVLVVVISVMHMSELGVVPGMKPQDIQHNLQERFVRNPPGWMLAVSMLWLFGIGLWLGGLVCSILGMRHVHRRILAILGLVLSATYALFLCGSLAMGLLAR